MATLAAGTIVDLSEFASETLRFLPPDGDLVIVVHPAALRARWDAHTQVAQIGDDGLTWLGALGEDMLVTLDESPEADARAVCAGAFLRGARLWDVVRPGSLLVPDAARAPSTVYGGSDRRPWVVLGETDTGDLIAAPLNEPSNPKWWTPVVPLAALSFPGSHKDGLLELAHVWSLPGRLAAIGEVTPIGRRAVEEAVRTYVRA